MLSIKIKNKVDVYRRILISYLYLIYFKFRNYFSKSKVCQEGGAYIISLTTFDRRINGVFYTIESIFSQKVKVEFEVHLYLCNDDIPNGIPGNLKRLQTRGLKIIIVDENLRSYKKLFFCYLENKDKVIITIDDDVFYPSWWLSSLIKKHIDYPESTIAFRSHFIKFNNDGSLKSYSEFIDNSEKDNKPFYTMIPTGVSGVLYPLGSLKGLEYDKEKFLSYSPSADDLWFKFVTLRNGFTTRSVTRKNIHFITIPDTQSFSLRQSNLDNNKNDIQLKSIIYIYPEIKEILFEEYLTINR